MPTGPGANRQHEQRAHPRFDTTIPTRFTTQGDEFEPGVVTSISAGGLFVRTPAPPAMRTRVWLDASLGPGEPRLRIRGEVVNLNRRQGNEVLIGFGLRFEDPPEDLADRVDAFVAAHPGPILLDADGRVRWPVTADAGPPLGGPGEPDLVMWGPRCWAGASGGDDGPGLAVGRTPDEYAAMVRGFSDDARSQGSARASFAYRGRPLAPSAGVPADALSAPASPWLDLLTTQMRLVDDLGASDWRLEEMWPEQIDALGQIRPRLAEARAAIDGEDACEEIERLDALTTKVEWCGLALMPAEVAPEAFEEWKRTRREEKVRSNRVATSRSSKRQVQVEMKRSGRGSRRRNAVVLALGTASLALAGYTVVEIRAAVARSHGVLEPLSELDVAAYVPIERVELDGTVILITVPFDWRDLPRDERMAAFSDLCLALSSAGYSLATVQAPDRTVVAMWEQGFIRLLN